MTLTPVFRVYWRRREWKEDGTQVWLSGPAVEFDSSDDAERFAQEKRDEGAIVNVVVAVI